MYSNNVGSLLDQGNNTRIFANHEGTNPSRLAQNLWATGSNLYATNLVLGGTVIGDGSGLSDLNLADGSITTAKLADGAIGSAQLASNLAVSGTGTATAFNGDGSELTNLRAKSIGSGQLVKSLNGLNDVVTLAAGANVTLITNGNTLSIASGVDLPANVLP